MKQMSEKTEWAIAYVILFGILAIVTGFAIFGAESGDTDKHWLPDRFNWSLLDIIGLIIFVLGGLYLLGLVFKKHQIQEGERTTYNAHAALVAMLIGQILIWAS